MKAYELLFFVDPASTEEVRAGVMKRIDVAITTDGGVVDSVEDWGKRKLAFEIDDLTHTYRRLTYRLEHCEADWKPSVGLFESDIVDGFIAGNTIDDIKESTLTNTLYTHYHLDIPNDNVYKVYS